MIPKYNWKNQYYNLLIRRFPKGYIIHIDGVEKIYFGNGYGYVQCRQTCTKLNTK